MTDAPPTRRRPSAPVVPTLRDGDVVLTDPRRRAKPGDLVVVATAAGATVVCPVEALEPGDDVRGVVYSLHRDF
jgi:SOS-response transcriptional repressor LexA